MYIFPYNRIAAVAYALKWALLRNPKYYNFDNIGGDCTNFVSQCVYAGSRTMNFTPTFGWYYISLSDRSPAWTGVEYFYNFMTTNEGIGPFATEAGAGGVMPGDVIQLGSSDGDFYHAVIITAIRNRRIYVSAHSDDYENRPLNSYNYDKIRYLHIEGVRRE